MKPINFAILIFSALTAMVIASCTQVPSANTGMRGMMNNGEISEGSLSGFLERRVEGLDNAKSTEIVEIAGGQTFNLEAKPIVKEINGNNIRMYGYNGMIPGPTIKIKQESSILVDFKNSIGMPTTIHWHGVRVENRYDGVAKVIQEPVKQGQSFTYKLDFPDAGIFWYHSHMREDLQQELGLYGSIIVEPNDSGYYNTVDREINIILDDLRMRGNDVESFGSIATFTLMGRFGNVMLVNGQQDYEISAKKGETARLFIMNAANSRVFRFSIDGHRLKVIGADIGKYEKEHFEDSIIIAPGERYIAEVLFENEGSFRMLHTTPSRSYVLGSAEVLDTDSKNNTEFEKLKENNEIKSAIKNFGEYLEKEPDYKFELAMSQNVMRGMMASNAKPGTIEWEDSGHDAMMNSMSNSRNVNWIIKDMLSGKENMDINYNVKLGSIKKIRLFNNPNSMHTMQHPMHLHGQRFLVLAQDGKRNDNMAWKDTVLVPAGSTVDILVEFSNPGQWMMHCHIAEHLEAGMMASFNVA